VLDALEANLRTVRQHQLARRAVLGLMLIGITGGILGATLVVKKLSAPTDLAAGKGFTLSSKWADCHPDQGRCGGYPTRVLFHTTDEKNPWFQIDLGAPTTFSKVFVQNRSDMARMRAVPLVLEVSDDGQTFKALGRRDDRFDTFTYEFPATTARYVRLRVDRSSTLHLEAVKVWK
jgi:F5/8 type C domain